MWVLYTVAVHVLLLGSIFVIYFRSPVISSLREQPGLTLAAPAKRLVLIVTDGLRAESFFRNNCADVPHLKQMVRATNAVVGISHTRVPTESRPGHIALIAGLYEDPSAVTRGWKENPIEFDTVFNRSRQTYAWGANDILHIFSRVTRADEKRLFFDSYSHDLDFSGKEKSLELDQWVFDRVKKVLARKVADIKNDDGVIFFLHLLGLDTAGHVHKPGSELFVENLHYTEKGISEMYDTFENAFPDNKTAYILTSDHGMTNSGSHGAGGMHETETPFILWGAGINQHPYVTEQTFGVDANETRPLFRMEQAQIAPLMSSLLGLAVPMNNFGILPVEFVNASSEYKYAAAHNNAQQLMEQFRALKEQHDKGILTPFLPRYSTNLRQMRYAMEQAAGSKNWQQALEVSLQLMQATITGIEYYFSYYKWPLLAATSATYLGFLAHLFLLLSDDGKKLKTKNTSSNAVVLAGLAVLVFCLFQRLDWVVCLYLFLPAIVWYIFISAKGQYRQPRKNLRQIFILVVCSELMVYTFFERRAISAAFLLFTMHDQSSVYVARRSVKTCLSILFNLLLMVFPFLPPSVGYSNDWLVYFSIAAIALRPFVVKGRYSTLDRVAVIVALFNVGLCTYLHSRQLGISIVSQAISWLYLMYVVFSLSRTVVATTKFAMERIIYFLSSLYCLLCTSYESLFILLLITALIWSLEAKQQPALVADAVSAQVSRSFRYAFLIVLFTFLSFFGTGNMASVNSFDPNIVRCFLTTFYPFVIMSFVILKLVIPIVLIVCIVFAMSHYVVRHERQIFICLLIVCDVMGLNFLFLVRNQGSWLEIGTSISHFVIMNVTTLVMVIFVKMSKYLLRLRR